jgi:hypothetical protein
LSQTTEASGVVRGIVLDENGHPVAAASVIAYPANRGFTHADRFSKRASGLFTHKDLTFGKYAIVAQKPSAFYSNTYSAFSAGDVLPPVIELNPDRPTATITVKLPGKAAAVVLDIRDATTGQLVTACVKFSRNSDTNKWIVTTSIEDAPRVLVPANTNITIAAWYTPYLRQTYSGSLRLRPTEVRHIGIKLVADPAAKNKTDRATHVM